MATGAELPLRLGGNYGALANSATTAHTIGRTTQTANWGRIQVVWLNSTTATFTGWPTGWSKFYDAAIGSLRCGVFWTASANLNQATNGSELYQFTSSASVTSVINGQSWADLDSVAGLAGTPVTVVGTASATTITVPSFACPDGHMPIWFVGAKYSAGGTSGSISAPADLVPTGSVSATTATGMGARCGAWTFDTGGENSRGLRSPASTGTKVFTQSGGTKSAWSGIAFAVKPADRGHLMAAA